MNPAPGPRADAARELLLRELELNGIRLEQTEWLSSTAVLEELAHALTPPLHEGRIATYGAILLENAASLGRVRILRARSEDLSMARQLADGYHSFLVYEQAAFAGLALFASPVLSELQLVRLLPTSGGLIVQRDEMGMTRFVRKRGITVQWNRSWFAKPHVGHAAQKILACVPGIERSALNRILEFAYHVLSPAARTGATLVWQLGASTTGRSTADAPPHPISRLKLSVLDGRDAAAVRHLLSQLDGATIIGPRGEVLATGVHLRYSVRSSALVPETGGTRHTSARRYSFDHPECIVITISEDGPVTIFSDGASIADLRARTATDEARILRTLAAERGREIEVHDSEVDCRRCGKTALVDEVRIQDCDKPHHVDCPVCGERLKRADCFSLSCRPLKKTDRSLEACGRASCD